MHDHTTISVTDEMLAADHALRLPLRIAAAPIPYAAYRPKPTRSAEAYPDNERALTLALDFYEQHRGEEFTDYDRRLFAEVRSAMGRPGYTEELSRRCFARVSEAENAERFRTRTRY